MSPVLKQVLIPTFSAVAGGLVVVGALRVIPAKSSELNRSTLRQNNEAIYDDIWNKQNGIQNGFDSILSDDFFDHTDPFKEMKRMREQMEKRMDPLAQNDNFRSNPFDTWFSDKFGGGTVNDISQREDDKFVYRH